MAKTQHQRNFRAKKKAQERERRLFAEIVLDRVAVEERITLRIERHPDAFDFVWGGPQDAYDDLHAFTSEHGYPWPIIRQLIEGIILERLLAGTNMKLAGPPRWIPSAEEKAEYAAKLEGGK